MRELVSRAQAAGYIILCDSTMPDRFGRMTSILNTLQELQPNAPTVMAANKQDHPQAWAVEDIRLALDVPDHIPIIPCTAGDISSVEAVVDRLIDELKS
jgi:signal recognition particle receptor subunit beta